MPTTSICRAAAIVILAVGFPTLIATGAGAEARSSKDIGPVNALCDRYQKESAAWLACVGSHQTAMPDRELFYAGYWLAKTGRYGEALAYLTRAGVKDEKILTYIGFATRKLGDVDGALPFYAAALELNPEYSVARAYLGEAYLSKGLPRKAMNELREIERRCGVTCAEYADLSNRISDYKKH